MNKEELELMNYDELFEKLEKVINELENKDVSLEKAIELYQNGVLLSQLCNQKLQKAEFQIQTLTTQNGIITEENFTLKEKE